MTEEELKLIEAQYCSGSHINQKCTTELLRVKSTVVGENETSSAADRACNQKTKECSDSAVEIEIELRVEFRSEN